jgi:hypothetical protein
MNAEEFIYQNISGSMMKSPAEIVTIAQKII